MISRVLAALFVVVAFVGAARAATFEYPVRITAISGEGEAMNIGFFSTGSVGDLGTGSARTDIAFPTETPTPFDFDNSIFGVTFPGIATAVSFSPNPVTHDPLAGTVTVNGFLGGLTGPYPGFEPSASAFEFVYSGVPGPIGSVGDYETFLSGATMSGFVSAAFFLEGEFDDGYLQRIDFESVSQVPLPAGALLLLSGLGILAIRRKA